MEKLVKKELIDTGIWTHSEPPTHDAVCAQWLLGNPRIRKRGILPVRNPELQEELQIQAAVAAGDVHTVRKMLEQGYSPNGRDANGWTLLHFSAARGKERCVRVFLEHG
eukprot:bmy_19428T0